MGREATIDLRVDGGNFVEPSPVPKRPVQWRRAAAALRALAKQEGDILNATYTVVDAMGGMCEERLFQKFRATSEGRRLLAERPDLPRILSDRDQLLAMPEGSLGRIYGELCARANINPMALVQSQHGMSRDYAKLDPARQWFGDRLTVLHDLWHIISGYAAMPRGEAAIVAFSYAQGLNYRPIPIFIMLSVVMKVARIRELWTSYRRGRRTPSLTLQRYEELLPLPLAEVRTRLEVPAARPAHGPHAGEGLLAATA